MSFVLLLIIIIAVIITLFFVEAFRIKFVFDTDQLDMYMTIFWLYPVFKALVTVESNNPILIFYLFNKKIFKRTIKKSKRKSKNMEIIKTVIPKDININAKYSSNNPFLTGIICGAINTASQFINIDSIKHYPDFFNDNDYIYLDANAKVNLGKAFLNYLKLTINRRKPLWSKAQT